MQTTNRIIRIMSGAMLGMAAAAGLPAHAAWNTPYTADFGATAVSVALPAPSVDRNIAIDPSDPNGRIYSLIDSGVVTPFRIVRRLKSGAVDTAFGANGYINSFPHSDMAPPYTHGFVALCIDPTTHYIVVVGSVMDQSVVPWVGKMFVQRLVPPASGNGTAQVDPNFNPAGTPGAVAIGTPSDNGIATGCMVEGDGTIVVTGIDNKPNGSRPVVVAKVKSDGTMASGFGTGGVAVVPIVDPVSGANKAGGSHITANYNQTINNNYILSGALIKDGDFDPYPSPGDPNPSRSWVAAIDRCTGSMDTRFNGTGVLINPTFDGRKYNGAGTVVIGDDGHIVAMFTTSKITSIDGFLDLAGPANLVDLPYPLPANGAPLQTSPVTLAVPTNFYLHPSAVKANGTIVVGGVISDGNPQALRQALTAYTGRPDLGFTPGVPAAPSCGNSGGQTIVGTAGPDELTGTAGNDTINGKAGADVMTGLAGNDVYIVDNAGDKVVEVAGEGTDTIKSSVTYKLPAYVEKLTLTGTASINGTGNGLNNVITGNAAANVLSGGSGNDTLKGLGGNDRLVGGPGNDTLAGGTGQDSLLFNAALNASTNVDKVTDFSPVDDTIRLENTVFAALTTTGTVAASAFKLGTTASTPAHRILYDTATGNLRYDADGTGPTAAVRFATLTTKPAINNLDFIVQ